MIIIIYHQLSSLFEIKFCSGRIHGPYGGEGGRYFEAIPPEPYNRDGKKIQCFLGWISGQSDRRLDSISFHWKCPKEPSHNYPEEVQTFKQYQKPESKQYTSNSNNSTRLCVNTYLLIFLSALSILCISCYRNRNIYRNSSLIIR